MKALVWSESNMLKLSQMDEPQISVPTEIKIKIHLTGICGTDLAVITGKEEGVYGVTRGHEAVGTVVEVGEQVQSIRIGDRVVIDPNQSCDQCYFCNKKQPHLCVGKNGMGMPIAGLNLQGTFAQYFVTEQQFVYRIPDSMSWETAVLIEPLACVLHNFQEADVQQDDSVLVLGSGPMGILCQLVSKKLSGFTVATEINPYRLLFAEGIADYAYTPEQLDEARISNHILKRKFDVIIDTVGNQLEYAERWIERGGRIIPFGINATYQFTFSPTKYTQNGIKIIGAGEYRYMFEKALQFAAELPELDSIVTKKYELDQHETAIHELLGYNLNTKERVGNETLKTVFIP
ncbi:threonine dehydrogenase-like Zn-dependent dehydrogenase [Paenibacillus sp. DS2015]|uniref:zinc-dependent alcohol dehydrogenase n=1 Tax=Paenibacillus sp. DS2015 TaxID=3373917 RepID=UPI003D240326